MSIPKGIYIVVRLGIILSLGFLPVAGFCAKDTVAVSIHGVNYSAEDFTYIVEDPENSKNTGGGETVGPFEAGGIMCCYELPVVWRSGIRIKVNQEFESRMDKKSAGSSTRVIEVPPYIDGKPGELWVVRAADGSIDIISSDYQPNHPKWPGQVKGWPVASIEYRRYRWSLYIKEAQARIHMAQNALDQLETSPAALAQESWNLDSKYHPDDLKLYSSPADNNFIERVKQKFRAMKRRNEEDIAKLQEQKP
ncbi:DUF3304 domain-containing protein [Duganella sp. FT109W]|uniref:DUF3304 domain-containing protein n=1 Tax=Duganella margarita TaxID=2692170 RepID=A0ABW9WKB2_9BURK|nr:DUF3304 domain-containing protein [Duganella margarita]MYN41265.1 DUF3304 domain-containing protein [Duganella margarita]